MIVFINSANINDKRVYYLDTDKPDVGSKLYTGIKDEYNYIDGIRTFKVQNIPNSDTTFIYIIESSSNCCGSIIHRYWNTIGDNWNLLNTAYNNLE